MIKRQKLIGVIVATAIVAALCGMVLGAGVTGWVAQPDVNWNAWLGGAPGWVPQPSVNWNAWLGAQQQVALALPGWLPQPSVNWNS